MADTATDLAGVEAQVRSWVAGLSGCSPRELTAPEHGWRLHRPDGSVTGPI